VIFEKEYIMRCSSAEWYARNEMMPSWCRQLNWGNCGIPWVNCAVLCVKDDWKGQLWGLRYCLSKQRVYSVFPSGMTSHSKNAQFNWQYITPFKSLSSETAVSTTIGLYCVRPYRTVILPIFALWASSGKICLWLSTFSSGHLLIYVQPRHMMCFQVHGSVHQRWQQW
jgi:hypothetical protein